MRQAKVAAILGLNRVVQLSLSYLVSAEGTGRRSRVEWEFNFVLSAVCMHVDMAIPQNQVTVSK